MQVHFEPLDAVLTRAQVALVADISTVAHAPAGPYTRELTLRATLVKTVFGESPKTSQLDCLYREGVPHWRGQVAVSPLVTGSGIEFTVAPGERVVLLLADVPTESNACRVLRIEPPQNETLVKSGKEKQ
jgi:hypothetical protein